MEKYSKKLLISILLILTAHTASGNLRLILASAHRYNTQQQAKLAEAICSELAKKQDLAKETILKATAALLDHQTPYPLINESASLIHQACLLFFAVPGFCKIIRKLFASAHNDANTKGALYEITSALNLVDPKCPVIGFGQCKPISDRGNLQEFDLETKNTWIECKCINWESVDKRPQQQQKMRKQFLRQKRCADYHNKHHPHAPVAYQVCSRHPIPDDWQEWLTQKKIMFVCVGDS